MIMNFILDSSHLFGKEEIKPDIKLLKGWSKSTFIRFISRINYLIHPNGQHFHGVRNCVDIWNKLTYSDKQIATGILRDALIKNSGPTKHYIKNAIFFNRLTNLYIHKLILVSDLYGKTVYADEIGEPQFINFLKFYSSCTKIVLEHEHAKTPSGLSSDEALAFKNLPQHVYNSSTDIKFSYFKLIHSTLKHTFLHDELKVDFENYFKDIKISSTHFLRHYLGGIFQGFRNTAQPESIIFKPEVPYEKEAKDVFNNLSEWNIKLDEHIFDFSSIKKYPFYKMSDNEYIKLDHNYAIQKFKSTIYDDCFFDYLKPNGKNIRWYNGCRGSVNEEVIIRRLNILFSRQRHTKLKFGESLKKDAKGNPLGFEIADYYARKGNKVFIAEIKSSSLSIAQMSGKFEDILSKSGDDFSSFLDKFGISQLVQHVKRLVEHPEYFENALPKEMKIYPAIIVSEIALDSTLIIKMLREKFDDLLSKEIGQTNYIIKPLCIIQDSIAFRMAASRIGRLIWYILDKHGRDVENFILGGTLEMRLNRLNIQEIRKRFDLAYMAGFK